jgi:hypothetical protein
MKGLGLKTVYKLENTPEYKEIVLIAQNYEPKLNPMIELKHFTVLYADIVGYT